MNIFFYFIRPFSCQNLSSIHAFVLHTNGLKVDADYIPEIGFSSRDLGANIITSIQRLPVLCNLFSELPSVVAIDKFDCIYICSFANTLTINNIPLDFMSCDLWIIFVCPIICNTVQYIHYRTTASWHVLGFDTQIFSRLITDWSVENMNMDVTPYRMHIDVSVSPKKKYIN